MSESLRQIWNHDPLDSWGLSTKNIGKLMQIYPMQWDFELSALGVEQPFIVGRDESCQLMLQDDSVSRRHAKIELSEEGYEIEDLSSMNGTYINGRRIERTLLQTRDNIRIGGRILHFLNGPDLEGQYRDAIFSMMTRDALTNCWNRRYAMSVLQRELKRRQRTRQPLSVLLLDLDRFKPLNDRFGHLVGDEVLMEVSRRLRLIIRDEDVLARYAGEQFFLVLCDTTIENARQIAERCRAAVSQSPIQSMAGTLDCSVSIGIGVANNDNPFMPLEELVTMANENLSEAKTLGRNRVGG